MSKLCVMHKIFFLILSTLATLSISSCKKESILEKGIINGVVLDATTNEPIPEAQVFLLSHEITGDIFGGSPSVIIDEATSATDGSFSFNIEYNLDYAYTCGAVKEMYFTLSEEFPVDDDIFEGNNVEVLLILLHI